MKCFSAEKATILGLILLFWALALTSLIGDSPTMDEQNHLVRGYAFLTTGDPRLSIEHPPLINLISALPLQLVDGILFSSDHTGWQNREWYSVANSFFWLDGNPVLLMVFMGRLPIVFLTLGLALAGYHAGNRFWGKPAGLLAFVALLFDPTIFAHGRYITTDLGGTLFIFLATLAVYNLFSSGEKWPIQSLLFAVIGIGLAFASKLTSITFVPIWILLALLPLYRNSKVGWRMVHLTVAGMSSLFIVWAVFGFEFAPFLFRDESIQWLNDFSAPMPTFWSGIEAIALLSSGERPSYLLGQFSTDGFRHYFPVAFAVKTPLFIIIGFIWGTIFLLRQHSKRQKTAFLCIPIALYMGAAMTSELNIGYRHLLPTLPFVYLIIAGALQQLRESIKPKNRDTQTNPLAFILYPFPFIVIVFLIPTIYYHPHQISFFNMLVGGPQNGANILIDSNIDWGQDLQRLKGWMDDNQIESVNLGWFGTAEPEVYQMQYRPMPGDPQPEFRDLWWNIPFDIDNPEPGIYAISVTTLKEIPHQNPADKITYTYFRNIEPLDHIGYSILIYEVK